MSDVAASRSDVLPGAAASAAPTGVFAELDKILFTNDAHSLHRVLQQVADAALEVVPGLAEVSVTVLEGGHARTVVFAGALAAVLDERQYEAGSGPCLDAAARGGTVMVDTADPQNPYPELSRAAVAHGITQVLAVGLPVEQRTAGALNMYAASPEPLSADSVALAETFAGYAAVAVANAVLHHSAVEEARQLHDAMQSRAVIEQAKGILMATRHCTPEQAFVLLTRASQRQNRKLREVALEFVERGSASRP